MIISPCYFHLWMTTFYIKILKSYAAFTNFFRATYESPQSCFYFMITSNVYITYMQLARYSQYEKN